MPLRIRCRKESRKGRHNDRWIPLDLSELRRLRLEARNRETESEGKDLEVAVGGLPNRAKDRFNEIVCGRDTMSPGAPSLLGDHESSFSYGHDENIVSSSR